ncbi:CPBP family intramembrane glutamic endopeptidase [Paractinoplanes hotanensis]|uniref:CPBP family intramembrane metalloprotease n=1 Tax=Paractinoplanes hotanensis TaxID=2906497 RepID=A0ABT0Y8Q9_9ACTN|nr:type II CAAX endopeptidase family protein [Actinoplanes hotanensis]MCM4082215.1 CPBP family intramembrane metalloprotease [Actinoplanes hotanensis]
MSTVVPAPADVQAEFHLRGRSVPGWRWWRPITSIIMAVAGSVLVLDEIPVLAYRLIGPSGGLPVLGPLTDIVVRLISIALVLPVVVIVTRLIGRRPATSVLSATGRPRWRLIGISLLIATPVPAAVLMLVIFGTVITAAQQGTLGSVPLMALAAALTLIVALIPLQALSEEALHRGLILQAASEYSRGPWPGIAVQATVFAALHGPGGSIAGYLNLAGYAVILGWLAVSTGGIEAGLVLHTTVNTMGIVALCLQIVVLGTNLDAAGATSADTGWQQPAMELPLILGYALLVRWIWRRLTRR